MQNDAGNDIPEIVELFRALAHPVRLRMMRLLLLRPMCVTRISLVLDIPQPTASRNLGILRRAGLVVRNQCANFARFAAAPEEESPVLQALFAFVRKSVSVQYDDEAVTQRLAELGTIPPKAL